MEKQFLVMPSYRQSHSLLRSTVTGEELLACAELKSAIGEEPIRALVAGRTEFLANNRGDILLWSLPHFFNHCLLRAKPH